MLSGTFNSIIYMGFHAVAKAEKQASGLLTEAFNHVAEFVEKVIEFHKSIFFRNRREEEAPGHQESRFYNAVHEHMRGDEKEDKSKSPRALELLALLKQVALAVAREEYPMTISALAPILAELESLGVYGAEMVLANAVPMHKNTVRKFVYAPAHHAHQGMALAA